jgi:hypothetical protein
MYHNRGIITVGPELYRAFTYAVRDSMRRTYFQQSPYEYVTEATRTSYSNTHRPAQPLIPIPDRKLAGPWRLGGSPIVTLMSNTGPSRFGNHIMGAPTFYGFEDNLLNSTRSDPSTPIISLYTVYLQS